MKIHSKNKANNIFEKIYAEKIYNQNFTAVNKRFVLSLHYNGDDSYLFANGIKN